VQANTAFIKIASLRSTIFIKLPCVF